MNDFVTCAPSKNVGGENAGRLYVYSGGTGALLWSADGAPGDQLGMGVEAAGDVNGDGIADVVASALGIDTAYVYSGADGRLLLTLTGARAGDAFGSAVAGYADRDHRFLVVGAPRAGRQHRGRIYVYKDLSTRPAFVFDADSTGVALGYMFVSVLGDVDGDGVPDIYASDWSDAAKGPGTGKIYVYSGRTGRRLHTPEGETAGEGFGTTQGVGGDVNGDGRADLIVGTWQYSVTAQSAGRAYLFDGRSGKMLSTYTSKIPGDTFGFDAVGMERSTPGGRRNSSSARDGAEFKAITPAGSFSFQAAFVQLFRHCQVGQRNTHGLEDGQIRARRCHTLSGKIGEQDNITRGYNTSRQRPGQITAIGQGVQSIDGDAGAAQAVIVTLAHCGPVTADQIQMGDGFEPDAGDQGLLGQGGAADDIGRARSRF